MTAGNANANRPRATAAIYFLRWIILVIYSEGHDCGRGTARHGAVCGTAAQEDARPREGPPTSATPSSSSLSYLPYVTLSLCRSITQSWGAVVITAGDASGGGTVTLEQFPNLLIQQRRYNTDCLANSFISKSLM